MSGVRPWPDEAQIASESWPFPHEAEYERARAEAYRERLEMAVEALKEINSDCEGLPRSASHPYARIARDALELIGPLPKEGA